MTEDGGQTEYRLVVLSLVGDSSYPGNRLYLIKAVSDEAAADAGTTKHSSVGVSVIRDRVKQRAACLADSCGLQLDCMT